MQIRFIILSGILFMALSFLSSCDKEECQLVEDTSELKPCDTSGIDPGIILDTIWEKSASIKYPDNIKFSDKYIIDNSDYREFEFYSIDDGTKIRKLDKNTLPGLFASYVNIKGDYLYGFSGINGSTKIFVHKYNIKTGELITTDSIGWCNGIAYEENYFYCATGNVIEKIKYDLSFRDTIYKFDGKFSSEVKMEIYKYPEPLNKKYLILTYAISNDNNCNFALINLETKKIEKSISLGGLYKIEHFSITEDMVNISKRDLMFSYDLKKHIYFSFHTNYYNLEKIYSISYRQTKNSNKDPVIFFKKPEQFSAYEMYYGKTLWTCALPYEGDRLRSLYPVDLYDEYGNVYTYMTYIRGSEMGLIDPYTGIIKAKFPKAAYFNGSHVYDENIIFFCNSSGIVKVKIRKK